jgi:hypothetical protein
MNIARKLTASLIMIVLVSAIWSTVSLSQDQDRDQSPQARENLSAGASPQARPRKMGAEEKLVRDIYARLMRYQSAARDELAAKENQSSRPQDYLVVELRDIRSGSIAEISDRSLSEMLTVRDGAVLNVVPNHLSNGDGPPHAYYDVEWSTATSKAKAAADPTLEEILRTRGADTASISRYTSYEVTVRLQGQQRKYRAIAVYHFDNSGELNAQTAGETAGEKTVEKTVRPTAVEIFDNIAGEMNAVLRDESPPVHAPWSKYVKTDWYRAVVSGIGQKRVAGASLIPADAPIGYLPGDDIEVNSMGMNDPCPPATAVSITVSGVANADKSTVGGLVVLNSDSNSAPRQQITVAQATPASYTGNVTLTRNNTKVKLFTAATGGTEITFNSTDNKFANSTLPKSFYVEGATFSGAMRDVTLTVTSDDAATDSATFTVLWVDQPTVSFSGALATDDAAKQTYINWTTASVDALGLQTYNSSFGERMGWGSEAAGVVHPATFNYPSNDLKLERDNAFHDWIGNGTSTIDQRNFSNTIPPANDTGPAQAMDTNPNPNGNIYDWDAAGLINTANAVVNQIRRTRNNFKAFASITVGGTAVRCSPIRLYYIRFSMKQTTSPSGHNWVILSPVDVTDDNEAAYGTTRLTWDLQ